MYSAQYPSPACGQSFSRHGAWQRSIVSQALHFDMGPWEADEFDTVNPPTAPASLPVDSPLPGRRSNGV